MKETSAIYILMIIMGIMLVIGLLMKGGPMADAAHQSDDITVQEVGGDHE